MFMPLMIFRRLVERGVDADRQAERLDEVTVDAEPDAQLLVERLDVDVARAVAHGLADDAVHELDDRRLVVEADLGGLGRDPGLVVLEVERGDEPVDVGVGADSCGR